MKNIHILPTDKPSNLTVRTKTNELLYSYKSFSSKNGSDINVNQNIYITSDEEIKEGFVLHLKKQEVLKVKGVGEKSKEIFHSKGFNFPNECKKIILTTDQDLIKDGVQAIDNEFLEWFVKNPSCEKVEVKDLYSYTNENTEHIGYKIIIPKEEINPNNQEVMFHEEHQEYFHEDFVDGKFVTVWLGKDYIPKEQPKQETLEEAAEKYINKQSFDFGDLTHVAEHQAKKSFLNGAKWQQEQDKNKYSEEEVIELLQKALTHKDNGEIGNLVTAQRQIRTANFFSWFEQFKKK